MVASTALSGRDLAGIPRIRRLVLLTAAAAALALGATGCVARAYGGGTLVYDYPVVEVETVPVQVETYPRYHYRGSYAYLVDGQWYYRSRGRWVVFRREPDELARARVTVVRDQRRPRRPVTVVPPAPQPRRHPGY